MTSYCKCIEIFMLQLIFLIMHSCTGYATICSRAMDLFKRALRFFAFVKVHSLSRAQTYLVVNEHHVELSKNSQFVSILRFLKIN